MAGCVGDVLASMPEFEEDQLGDILRENMTKLGNKVADGNHHAFSVLTGVHSDNASGWLAGRHLPRPSVLFQLCHRLQISTSELLRRNGNWSVPAEIAAAGFATSRRGAWRDDPDRIEAALLDALKEDPPPSLKDIAFRHDYRTCIPLRRLDPDTCKQIALRYRAFHRRWYNTWAVRGRECTRQEIECILKESLARERPIPITQIAAQLGHESPQRLQTHFPELCKAIAQKAAECRRKSRERLRVALVSAIAEDPPPTARSLAKRMGCSQSALDYHFPDLCRKLQATRKAWKASEREAIRLRIDTLATEMKDASVREICLKAGVTSEFLLTNFPALYKQIASKHMARVNELRQQRRAVLHLDVQRAVVGLSRVGVTPTLSQVIPLLSAEAARDWNRIRQEISDTIRRLNSALFEP
jgi:hypothetical protein